jgi:hypothetical protein
VDSFAAELIAAVRQSGFRDIAGSRLSITLPVSRALINRIVNHALARTTAPVSAIDIRPQDGDRFEAIVTLTSKVAPPLPVRFNVDRQPQFPDSPALVLRWSFLGGFGAIATRFVGGLARLPPGVRLEEDRLFVDVRTLLANQPAAEVLPFITRLELHTAADRATLDVDLQVPENR